MKVPEANVEANVVVRISMPFILIAKQGSQKSKSNKIKEVKVYGATFPALSRRNVGCFANDNHRKEFLAI